MNTPLKAFLTAAFILVCVTAAYADAEATGGSDATHGLPPMVLIGLAAMLLVAKLGGELFERLKQPAVLGELIGGIIIGNLVLLGFTAAEPLKTDAVIAALAQLGVILLLFEVGLESNLSEMLEVGWSSLFVAVAGVVAPFFWAGPFLLTSFRLSHVWFTFLLVPCFVRPAWASPHEC
jgi:Kef-type K+ transport system membrane component KefB